jgi:hypothetical protein
MDVCEPSVRPRHQVHWPTQDELRASSHVRMSSASCSASSRSVACVKAGGESLPVKEHRRQTPVYLLCPPPRPRFLALWSSIIHRGPHQTTCGLVGQCALVVLDGRQWRRRARARQGRERLCTGARKTPAVSSCLSAASPCGPRRARSSRRSSTRRARTRPSRVVSHLIAAGSVRGPCVAVYAGLTHFITPAHTRVISQTALDHFYTSLSTRKHYRYDVLPSPPQVCRRL